MLNRRIVVSILSVVFICAGAACAQGYPSRPIRLLAAAPGGNTDFTGRIVAQAISGPLGQNVVIDNRPSSVESEILARSTPDGYILLVSGNILWIAPLVEKTPYDPIKDFSPITLVTATPQVVVVHPSVAANSIKEIIALAKARPGELNYASGPSGAPSHLGPELFKAMAGLNIVRVPYKGSGPALSALIAGEVQLMVNNAGPVMPHVRSGRLRALAATSAQPSVLLPGLPTVSATGVPGYEAVAFAGIFAPAGTPRAIINRLNHEIVRAINRVDVKEKFLNVGAEVVGSSPEEFAAKIKSEVAKWGKVIKDAGIKAD